MGTEAVYLPGDRDVVALAEAIARDNRLNPEEHRVMMNAYRCCCRRSYGYPRWRCTTQRPCVYCQDVQRLCS